jgi:uncharacterized NAD(P)/FAD-binding protein YdhS
MGTRCTTLVIGGGAAGALTSHHLLHGTDHRILLVEPAARPARGLAYASTDDQHLLNSRAIAMSVDSTQPAHFLHWAHRHGLPAGPTSFLPRRAYGDYLAESLALGTDPRLHHIRATVSRLTPHPGGGLRAALDTGAHLHADRAVLATGHAAPRDPYPIGVHPRYIGNPWTPGALDAAPDDQPVLLIGTGLTAVDVALTLHRRPRHAPVHAISRRGQLPQAHVLPHATAAAPTLTTGPLSHLIRQIRTAATHTDDWRTVVDGLRPHTSTLWQQLTPTEQRRFIRHVARWWETHRHRMAPAVAARVADLRATGLLHITAGEPARIEPARDGFTVTDRTGTTRHVGAIVNCTGPGSALHQPLIRSLIAAGHARPDRHRLGLDVTADGTLTSGAPIHVIGPARRGQLWETTAVPEIRNQAEALASRLARVLSATG